MITKEEVETRNETADSLKRIQEFDVNTLPREEELGQSYSFADAVEPAERMIALFKRLSLSALDDFGKTQLDQLKTQTDACYNIFDSVLGFDATVQNAHSTKESLINKIRSAYQGAFNVVLPLVGYSLHKTADFQRLETDARAAL